LNTEITPAASASTQRPLGVIAGAQTGRTGLYINLLERVSHVSTGIVDPVNYRAYLRRNDLESYVGDTFVPPVRSVIHALCTDETFIGIKRIDYTQVGIFIDVFPSHRHLLADYLNSLLRLIAEFYERKLKLFIDTSDWLEHELPLLMGYLAEIDPEAVKADSYMDLELDLFRFRHPEVPAS
jgi:hypothetical protein